MSRLARAEALINETVRFYSNNPRAVEGAGYRCVYLTLEGHMCAVGRLLAFECMQQIQFHNLNHKSLNRVSKEIDLKFKKKHKWLEELKPEMQQTFLTRLQRLHDNSLYWDNGILSAEGEDAVARLKAYIRNIFE